MADTTAVLGLAVDSRQAEADLRRFEAIARKTGETAEQVRDRYAKASAEFLKGAPALQQAVKGAEAHAAALSKLSVSTSKASAALAAFSRVAVPLAVVVGAVAGLTEAITKLSALGDRMQDTRLSEGMLQGLKVGAAEARVSQDDLNKAINTFTEVSKKAAPEAKEFYKALSNISPAMAQAFKDQAGQVGGQDQRLYILADALKAAKTETERFKLAQKALGTDNERTIAIFVRGAMALNDYQETAKKYGMVVDTALIQKAQEAQRALNVFSTVLSSRVSVAMADLIPVLTKMLPYLERLISGLASFLANYTALGSKGSAVLSSEIDTIDKKISDLEARNAKVRSGELASPLPAWMGGAKLDDTTIKLNQGQIDQLKEQRAQKQKLLEDIPMGPFNQPSSGTTGFTPRPSLKDDPATPFDRAVNSISRHIAAMNADAKAVGLSVGEHAKLRVEAQLVEAGMRGGLSKAAVEASEKYKQLGQAAADAAMALAKARIASDISFDRQTAFLSSEDVSIAQQLRQLYGNDVPAALASAEAAALRMNNAFKGVASAIENNLGNGLTDIAIGAKSLKDGFADMTTALIKDITRLIIQMTILRPLMSSISGLFGGGGIGAALGSMGITYGLPGTAGSNLFGPVAAAGGGHISGPGSGTSDSIPAWLSNGEFVVNAASTARHLPLLHAINDNIPMPRFAAGGLNGNVVRGNFGGAPVINIINQSSGQVEQGGVRQNQDGSFDVFIRDAVRGVISDDVGRGGPITKTMKAVARGNNGS